MVASDRKRKMIRDERLPPEQYRDEEFIDLLYTQATLDPLENGTKYFSNALLSSPFNHLSGMKAIGSGKTSGLR